MSECSKLCVKECFKPCLNVTPPDQKVLISRLNNFEDICDSRRGFCIVH